MHRIKFAMGDHGRGERADGFHITTGASTDIVGITNAEGTEGANYGNLLCWRVVRGFLST